MISFKSKNGSRRPQVDEHQSPHADDAVRHVLRKPALICMYIYIYIYIYVYTYTYIYIYAHM